MVENTRKGDLEQMAVKVDSNKCTKEATCPAAEACPFDALVQATGGTVPTVDEDTCSDCGICVDECPAGALTCE